jgi:hypothetical protein
MKYDTTSDNEQEKFILSKIRMLPPDKISEVANFIDFISQKCKEQNLIHASGKISEKTFAEVWDNSEDDIYDHRSQVF